MNKIPLIIIAGPTATGKSEFAVQLAEKIGGEIISADSMQVYTQMNIGTAKVTREEMGNIPHYMIDEIDPKEAFDVTIFQKKVNHYIQRIIQNGKIPILVGGTGFYIQSVLYAIEFTQQDNDTAYREALEDLLNKEGVDVLYEKLKKVDPDACQTIHANNTKRVIRALEFYHLTGEQISKHNAEQQLKTSPYHSIYFVLNMDRELLYERINQRVDTMFEKGLVNEVENLRNQGYTSSLVSMQGIGYKEILEALEGKITLDEAKYQIKRNSRHFAKRQLTWFKREENVVWLDRGTLPFDNRKILEEMIKYVEVTGIIG